MILYVLKLSSKVLSILTSSYIYNINPEKQSKEAISNHIPSNYMKNRLMFVD